MRRPASVGDGVLVVVHDPTLERTTGERGLVAARTAAELRTLDAGARFTTDGGCTFPWRGRGATISTFDEVLDALPEDMPCIVELKTPAAAPLIAAAITHRTLRERVIVAGLDSESTRSGCGTIAYRASSMMTLR